jgi:hypothetical protein
MRASFEDTVLAIWKRFCWESSTSAPACQLSVVGEVCVMGEVFQAHMCMFGMMLLAGCVL